MKLLCSLVVLMSICGLVWPDVYLHNCRGSNNRLDEENRERNNANRLFDSQNNNRGGYNVGGDGHGEADPMKMQVGSMMRLEWTNQHECGQENTHCNLILQYMCAPHLRDGTSTSTISIDGDLEDDDKDDQSRGQHESQRSYGDCQTRERNNGLYHGDQDLERGSAKFTRQNPDGTRRGLECPEERDYYPYWGPTEWKDIAILMDDLTKCKEMAKESQNVKPRSYCRMTLDALKDISNDLKNEKVKDEVLAPLNQQACADKGDDYEWFTAPAFDIPEPECVKAPLSRDNHNGNSFVEGQEGSDKIPQTSFYMWKIPNDVHSRCAVRLRYNISVGDYQPLGANSADDTPDDDRETTIASIPIGEAYGMTRQEAAERGYEMENNPVIKPLKINGVVQDDFELELAINTAQTGRVFQDRCHRFSILERDSNIPADAAIHNVNVRGKRGNIVQVYPAVEYDFVPNDLVVQKGEYVHYQWTGSLKNNNDNDGEGERKTDKNNIIVLKDRNFGGDQPAGRAGWPGNNYPQSIDDETILNLGRDFAIKAALPRMICNGQDNGCCTSNNPCPVGEGDCDRDSECMGDLRCGTDNCPWGDQDDCCVAVPEGLRCNGQDDGCCTSNTPCDVGEGDCDRDSHCKGDLKCGTDNCPWGDYDDCCVADNRRKDELTSTNGTSAVSDLGILDDVLSQLRVELEQLKDTITVDKNRKVVASLDNDMDDSRRRRHRRSLYSNPDDEEVFEDEKDDVALLNKAPYYVDLKPQQANTCGKWHYMCTRNNNFSNRGEKATVTVACAAK